MDLNDDEILQLPLDELALRVLIDARATRAWNWQSWLVEHANQGHSPDAMQAWSEAWGWLQAKGLIAWTYGQSSSGSFSVSRRGQQVLIEGLPWLRAVERLDVDLVPELEYSVRPLFLRGDFETAAFAAHKAVEVAVRARAGFGTDLIGTSLMTQAFRPPKNDTDNGGPLHQPGSNGGEATATMQLFAGAIGLFKNPASHRPVDYDDPTMAVEVVLLADLLLRILNRLPSPDPDAGNGTGRD